MSPGLEDELDSALLLAAKADSAHINIIDARLDPMDRSPALERLSRAPLEKDLTSVASWFWGKRCFRREIHQLSGPTLIGSGMASMVELRKVSKKFGSFTALEEVSFEIAEGEFMTFLGPSGCGKTTCLRLISGLENPSTGEVFIAGKNVTRDPPYRRSVNQVFQSYALFRTSRSTRNFLWLANEEAGRFGYQAACRSNR